MAASSKSAIELLVRSFSVFSLVAVCQTSYVHRAPFPGTFPEAPLVETAQGALYGVVSTARNGRLFNSYLGIPYAQPPVGVLRFQPPQESHPWPGVLNASSALEECIQVKRNSEMTAGTEDCLHVNVHTPQNSKPGDNIPVIIFIHGGSFKTGSNTREGPEYIMALGSVILVQPNYRLGLFGLLSTGDSVIPGNMALKDQTMAIRWTKRNIYAFGGDPNRVTIAGHSSGATCVSLHTVSPLSNGLFERAIIMSGAAFSPTSVFSRTVAKNMAEELARTAGCPRSSSEEILKCFTNMDANAILKTQQKLKLSEFGPASTLRAVIEEKTIKDAFLTEYPAADTFPSRSVQWMIGHTSSEAAQDVAGLLSDNGQQIRELNDNYKMQMPISLGIITDSKPAYIDYILQILRAHYLGNEPISAATDIELLDLFSNVGYNLPVIKAIKSYDGLRFAYLYDYRSNFSTQLHKFSYPKYLGVGHVDDLQLLFKRSESADSLSREDVAFGNEMLTRWSNFAHSGNPNEPYPINVSMFDSWIPVTSDRVEYLRLRLGGTMESNLDGECYQFLNAIPWTDDYS